MCEPIPEPLTLRHAAGYAFSRREENKEQHSEPEATPPASGDQQPDPQS